MTETKKCATCKRELPVSEMHPYGFGRSTVYECRECYEKMSGALDKYAKAKIKRILESKSYLEGKH